MKKKEVNESQNKKAKKKRENKNKEKEKEDFLLYSSSLRFNIQRL
jgi:hypothetical protein